MGLIFSTHSGRATANRRDLKTASTRRARSGQKWGMIEALEGRCLLAVTSTTPIAFAAIETNSHTGNLMSFTANDAGPFTADIVWGDLTSNLGVPVVGGVVTGTHTYANDGSYTVAVTIRDAADGTFVANNTTATISEFSLSAVGANFTTPENSSAPVTTANFTDPGSPDPASSYTGSINWGDGTTTPGVVSGAAGNYSVSGVHAYADEGSFTVTTTFFENSDAAFTITANSTATITEADVLNNGVIAIPPGAAIEGVTYNGPVATFSDPGNPTNVAADFNTSINWGDGTTTAGTLVATGGGNFTLSGVHTYVEEGALTVTANIADNAPGTAAITISQLVTIADAALTAAPVAVNGTEGAPLTNVDVATFTDADVFGNVDDFLATINWGDGTPVAGGTIVQDAAGTFHVQGSHTYADENAAVYPITVSILDNGGGRTIADPTNSKATANSTATIVQSPLLPVANAVVGVEGTAIAAGTPLASFTDSGGADPIASYTATVNWGDGSATTAATVTLSGTGGNFQVTSTGAHTYANEGIYAVTVTMTDNDATAGAIPTTAATTSTATISDAALTASAAQPAVPAQSEGKAFAGAVSSFTDANPTATLSDYVATIDWGDGSPTSLGSFTQPGGVGTAITVNGVHTFKQDGAFTIRVVTTDVGGQRVTATTAVIVGDPGLSGAAATPVRAVEGANTGQVTLGSFVDPDPNATAHDWSASINWGDGTPAGTATIVLAGGDPATGGTLFKIVGGHTYADENSITGIPAVTITDVDNAGAAATVLPLNITVVDAALASQGGSVQGVEGVAFTSQLIATFTDSNPGATVADFNAGAGSISIAWGDGSTSTLTSTPAVTITSSGSPNGVVFSVFGSHTYAEEGSYKVTVTATDTGGSTTIAHSEADVADATLAAPAQTAISTTESPIFPVPVFGAPIFAGAVGTFTDVNPGATVDDFRAVIYWGDGTPATIGTVSQAGGAGTAFSVGGSHTYADAIVNGGTGIFKITIFVDDVGGSKLTINNTANVADTAITLTGVLDTASDSGQSNTDAITNVNHPVFHGTSEPYSNVVLFATPTAGGPAVQVGQTKAGGDGSWTITSTLLADGSYTISGSATDQFGMTTTGNTTPGTQVTFLPNVNQGPLVIDTVGPRVTNLSFDRLNGEVDATIQDERSGLNQSTLLDSSNYSLTKPHTRANQFLVTHIVAPAQVNPTDPESIIIGFNGGAILKGGFYTFTIRSTSKGASGVQDIAGNLLDGEFTGGFPSGNGIVGGDFVAMLDAYHNKVFAPQTVVGTANVGNNGQGGNPVGAPHSGVHTPVTHRRPGTGTGQPLPIYNRHLTGSSNVHVKVAAHPSGPMIRRK